MITPAMMPAAKVNNPAMMMAVSRFTDVRPSLLIEARTVSSTPSCLRQWLRSERLCGNSWWRNSSPVKCWQSRMD
jgi:hypothetical protein